MGCRCGHHRHGRPFRDPQLGAVEDAAARLESGAGVDPPQCAWSYGSCTACSFSRGAACSPGGGSDCDGWTAARIWTVSSLGKYIPGKVWAVAGMALMSKEAGIEPWAATGSADHSAGSRDRDWGGRRRMLRSRGSRVEPARHSVRAPGSGRRIGGGCRAPPLAASPPQTAASRRIRPCFRDSPGGRWNRLRHRGQSHRVGGVRSLAVASRAGHPAWSRPDSAPGDRGVHGLLPRGISRPSRAGRFWRQRGTIHSHAAGTHRHRRRYRSSPGIPAVADYHRGRGCRPVPRLPAGYHACRILSLPRRTILSRATRPSWRCWFFSSRP